MKLDNETQEYIKDLQNKFFDLQEFSKMSEKELVGIKVQIEQKFISQMNETNEKFKNLKLIKEILEIDLNYYNKQLKNIKTILKNDNFKVSINIINEKISRNEQLSTEEVQQITFYNKLVNQKIYIEKVILSDRKIFKSTQREMIKKELFNEMKNIEEQTKIFLKENEGIKFDYQKIMSSYNDYQLQKLLSSLNEMIFEDKNESLRYKIIENLHILTKKSYKEIHMILKDNKFKEKLFGNLKIETVNEKLNILSEKVNQYKEINHYLEEVKKITYVCHFCNYTNDLPINVILHTSLHKKYVEPVEFNLYHLHNQLYSTFSVSKIESISNHFYDMKMKLFNDKDIKNTILVEDINKSSFQDMKQPLFYLNRTVEKINNMKIIEDFKNSMTDKKSSYGKFFNMSKEIKEIINEQVEVMEKNKINIAKSSRIVNFKIFKMIFNKFITDDNDINNLYNTVIEYYDNTLKTEDSFDLLFKNIIHYNNKKPVETIYQMFKKLLKIIKGVKTQNYGGILYTNIKNKKLTDAFEYVDTKTLFLLTPILKSLDLLNNISENLESEDDIKVDDNFNPNTWTNSKNYNKLVNKVSNITKSKLVIQSSDKQTEEVMEQFTRLNEMFQNVDMKKLKKMEKQYDLIFESYLYMIKNNMFLHNISNIDSNKNVQDKYNEYINGTFLLITMNYMELLMNQNKNNLENTKETYNSFFKVLSLYLNEESNYLKSNKVVKRKVVRQQDNVFLDNRDELLNEYFESDDEDFNEEIGEEDEVKNNEELDVDVDLEEELFGYDDLQEEE